MTHKERIARYLAERRLPKEDPELFAAVRKSIHEEHPTHSLFRGALAHEAYGAALKTKNHIPLKRNGFLESLKIGLSPEEYLREAKANARAHQYNPDVLTFANNGRSKLTYNSPEGPRHFGKPGYKDFIMWQHLEKHGKVRKGTAEGKRRAFRESHEKISETYQLGKHSPNELALKILWG